MANARSSNLRLQSGSRVAIMGGGPAGSFLAYFLLEMARRVDLTLEVDIYEPRDFSAPGPVGCNMCGGLLSESLVQSLAAEGICLPETVVQRGIDAYTLHMDVGSVQIDTPAHEKRIAAIHRGSGPRGLQARRWQSFDGYLQALAVEQGAHVIRKRVDGVQLNGGRPELEVPGGAPRTYDLLAVTAGVNTNALKLFEPFGYQPPQTTKTHIREYYVGEAAINHYLGSSMHVFLLNLPRLDFAALIPKGDYVTACLLGDDIDAPLIQSFFDAPEVRACMPPEWHPTEPACHCSPRINVGGAPRPFTDRLVFIGDCGVTRLYKDGIGAAYRAAKVAAATAVFEGVSAQAFRRHYAPACRALRLDNDIGRLIFWIAHGQLKQRHDRLGILKMIADEQRSPTAQRMSTVLWDLFTGSATYRSIFLLTLHPLFLIKLLWSVLTANSPLAKPTQRPEEVSMFRSGALGKTYQDGELIVRQGDVGDCMYVIQDGQAEVWRTDGGRQTLVDTMRKGEFFGEMALFDNEVRSATVKARGEVRVITVDKGTLLRRIHEDPSFAYRLLQGMSGRMRGLLGSIDPAKKA